MKQLENGHKTRPADPARGAARSAEDLLASQLLRALRGRRSQRAFSKALGYRTNAAYSWESGRRHPPASVLFRAVRFRGAFSDKFADFLKPLVLEASPRHWSRRSTAELLNLLVAEREHSELAPAVGVDRSTLWRWLRGATEPRVPELLRFIEVTTRRLVEFVELFTDPGALPVLKQRHADLLAQRRLAYELPMSHAVLHALELDEYRRASHHDADLIARALGVPVERSEALLQELSRAGQIKKRRGRWQIRRVLTVDTRSDPQKNRELKAFWSKVSLERLERTQPGASGLFSYNLFAVSHADLERIRRLHVEYYEKVRQIVGDSNRADRVVLLQQALAPLDE